MSKLGLSQCWLLFLGVLEAGVFTTEILWIPVRHRKIWSQFLGTLLSNGENDLPYGSQVVRQRCEQILMRAEKLAMIYLNLEGGLLRKTWVESRRMCMGLLSSLMFWIFTFYPQAFNTWWTDLGSFWNDTDSPIENTSKFFFSFYFSVYGFAYTLAYRVHALCLRRPEEGMGSLKLEL